MENLEKLLEIGLTKNQIDELCKQTNVGINIITKVLIKAKKNNLIKINHSNNQ